jgi:hypothetical protein
MIKETRALPSEAIVPVLRRAEVLSIESADSVWVRYHNARTEEVVRVELAVPQYLAEVGDWLLVSESADDRFAIGLLGEARRRASVPAVLHVRADERLILEAPAIEIRAHGLDLEAKTLIERSESSHRYSSEAHQSCGRMRTLVEGDCEIVAGRATIVADADTRIDGRRVLLG